ncbi:hypothetical protein DFJ74DRAFT_706597 [Hyaloraphidium curvatum]|nr:hypothetical protein DFJ74DRAFT_706597 [Hyaloraphidium curvatum]
METPQPVSPLCFTPDEFLLLFPDLPASESPLAPLPADPAAELRVSRTRAWLLGALPTPLLRGITRLQFALAPLTQLLTVSALLVVEMTLIIATGWAFRSAIPVFGTTQLAAGTAVFLVGLTPSILAAPSLDASFRHSRDPPHHPLTQLALWAELARRKPSLSLLRHDADVPAGLCPCPAATCAGSLPGGVGLGRLLEVAYELVGALAVSGFVPTSTALYGAYISLTWTTGWSTALAVLFVALNTLHSFCYSVCVACLRPGMKALELSLRLHHQAALLSLQDLVGRFRNRLSVPAQSAGDCADLRKEETFTSLHGFLVLEWQGRLSTIERFITSTSMVILTFFVFGIVFVSTGSCLPMWLIGYPIFGFGELLAALLNFTASNAQVYKVTRLFALAEKQLADLAARADPSHPALPTLRARLRQLRLCADGAPYTARVAGIDVGPGFVRALLVTLFTVCVGLFTLLKGAGVRFTIESFCPLYD